jgi:hypothetical protein
MYETQNDTQCNETAIEVYTPITKHHEKISESFAEKISGLLSSGNFKMEKYAVNANYYGNAQEIATFTFGKQTVTVTLDTTK